MPTGGGKSICYQVPALMLDGLTLVISPLIALMTDQVENLKNRNIRAACIHSNMHYREMERILDSAQFGGMKLLYISPERLQSRDFWTRLKQLPVKLLAVDEAHCISMWGYDFRPSYLKIAEVKTLFPDLTMVALTATATEFVLEDIGRRLEMTDPVVYRSSFFRSNLKFGVLSPEDKLERVARLMKKVKGPAIIYVRNRRQTREIAMYLSRRGVQAGYYHAGLEGPVRNERQSQFMQGSLQVMVATNAFGMGIDKSDVRMVIHFDLPDSLEAYYQEAGRAGRDGKDSYAILLYQERDYHKLLSQFEQTFPDMSEVRRIYRALGNYLKLALGSGEGATYPFEVVDFARAYDLDTFLTWNALKILEQAGWIALSEGLYQPSRLHIPVDKTVLYDYQLRNPGKDRVIRAILRLYQGVMSDYAVIKERQIESLLGDVSIKLRQVLMELQQDQIVDYIPSNDQGRITLLQPRVHHDNLTIDHDLLAFRKKCRKKGIENIREYVHLTDCRQGYLIRYFGDHSVTRCGICDNCRKAEQNDAEGDDFHILKEQITASLHQSERTISELKQLFDPDQHQMVISVIQKLIDEELIVKRDNTLSAN